jgi:uncharacterized membrane protein
MLLIGWCLRRILHRASVNSVEASEILALGSSSFLLLGIFLPEYVLGKTPSPIKSAILLSLSLCLFAIYIKIGLYAAISREKPLGSRWNPKLVLAAFCVIYFVFTTWFALAKLRALGYIGQDIAYFTQCLYTTLHGHLFYSNMYHDLLYREPVSSDFAGHNQLTLFLFLPFYAFHKSADTLLILRNVLVVLCAWPVYLISRRVLSHWQSVLAAAACLLMPAVLYQNIYDFAPLSVAGLPLLFALYYFLEGRFKPFVLTLLLTQIVREDLVFSVLGIGLLAWFQHRSIRWVAAPCGLAVGWAILSWKIIFPHFLHGTSSVVTSCFAYLGPFPGAMLNAAKSLGTMLSHNNLVYLKQLVDSLGGILFIANPSWLISLPYVAINLFGQGGGCNTAIIYRHYSLIPALLLFCSFLISLGRVGRVFGNDHTRVETIRTCVVFFVFAAALSSTVFVTGRSQFNDIRSMSWHAEAQQVAAMLPKHAAIAVPRYMLPSLANREHLYQSLRLLEYHHPDAQYIVLDKDWNRMAATEQWKANYYKLWDLVRSSSNYSVLYDSSNYLVYERCDGCPSDLPHIDPRPDAHE